MKTFHRESNWNGVLTDTDFSLPCTATREPRVLEEELPRQEIRRASGFIIRAGRGHDRCSSLQWVSRRRPLLTLFKENPFEVVFRSLIAYIVVSFISSWYLASVFGHDIWPWHLGMWSWLMVFLTIRLAHPVVCSSSEVLFKSDIAICPGRPLLK